MSSARRTVVDHSFHGGRFDDGGFDIDAIPELTCYKDLLVDVAEELWHRSNPTRERLPSRFRDSLTLKFYSIRPNCVTIPLERVLSADDRERLLVPPDELDDAVGLVADAIAAGGADRPLPDAFPRRLLHRFREYGKTLKHDEWIELRPAGRGSTVRFDAKIRDRLVATADKAYEDAIDITGEVTMARVSKPRMALELSDGREVEAAFRAEDEDAILTALRNHQTARLRVVGRGQFSACGDLQKIVDVTSTQLQPAGMPKFEAGANPIWEEIADIVAAVPDDELAKIPSDGAARHDFYIYGGGSPP